METKRVSALGGALALGVGLAFAPASPASASSMYGCVYPRVCFYLTEANFWNSSPTAAYQDVTSTWQTLSSRAKGAKYIVNTRNDDVIHLHYTNGQTNCLESNSIAYETSRIVDKVRISSASSC
ncbi:hypothetical protein GCE86_24280 [Micromonospora terminaliae]|uniref:Peptidase inhibitor family I36 protein n=1 Tax=Micromonospora terminaliae TaxID=1914461 RepID=A0AAJ2ZKS0_9ACTN|nr:hypothetical protein [Micromonospora terminaliae]NES31782.1 hypothetical protein [Micromonospora terminaliae]QGL49871.1 hypothetical protein GCE86_24280 [Micromonospora terminaliae]